MLDVVSLTGHACGQDVGVVAATDGRESMSPFDARVLERLPIEADALHCDPTEIRAQLAKGLGLLIDDGDRMALTIELVGEQRAHATAPQDDDVHAATLHASGAYPDAVSSPGAVDRDHSSPRGSQDPIRVGDEHELSIERVAHGGHMVARLGSFVVFVRHALPGERVRARITHVRSKFAHADVTAVLESHPDRRAPACSVAGVCGGCDFLHASESLQRVLKGEVLREALVRHGRLDPEHAQALLGDGVEDLGLDYGWRTRMHYRVVDGSVALKGYRSDDLVDVRDCLIADPGGHAAARRAAGNLPSGADLWMATGTEGITVAATKGSGRVGHSIVVDGEEFEFETSIDGFWQVHPRLAQALVDVVLAWGDPQPGETWWDLYSGVGPLAAAVGHRVGPHGTVHAVESSGDAVRAARAAVGLPQVRCHHDDVHRWLRKHGGGRSQDRPNGVVVDPPRSGAGAAVVESLVRARPDRIVLIACDPVALGRDTALLATGGYRLDGLHAWDAFPQTHHFETIAIFRPEHRIS